MAFSQSKIPPKYELVYFNGQGRAEISRWIFAAAEVEYEDKRIEPSKWVEIKEGLPYKQLPVLLVDSESKMLYQSVAIARYLARQFGLAGKSTFEEALADAIIDTVVDMGKPMEAIMGAVITRDQKRKDELTKKYLEDQYPKAMADLEKTVSDSGFFVGDEMTWADICFAQFFDSLFDLTAKQEDFSSYPKLKKCHDAVRGHPKIAAWIEKRPKPPSIHN